MITKFDLFLESFSPLLYHFTYIKSLVSILEQNALKATTSVGTDADKYGSKLYYFSMQRSKNGKIGYAASIPSVGKTSIVIDGTKLKDRYKGVKVDYWSGMWKGKDIETSTRFNENEERIITDEPYISNAAKYIEEIHVCVSGSPEQLTNTRDIYLKAAELAKKHNISIYFYTDEKAMNFQLKQKAVDIEEVLKDVTPRTDKPYIPRLPRNDVFAIMIALGYKDTVLKKRVEDLVFNSSEMKQLVDSTNDMMMQNGDDIKPEQLVSVEYYKDEYEKYIEMRSYGLKYPFSMEFDELVSKVANSIHYLRTDNTKLIVELLHILTKDMRKHKVETVKEYLKTKADKE